MPWHGAHLLEQGTKNGGWSRRLRIGGLADDPEKSIFGQRAGRPRAGGLLMKPRLCTMVMDMNGIAQSDQNVDIQKVHRCEGKSAVLVFQQCIDLFACDNSP